MSEDTPVQAATDVKSDNSPTKTESNIMDPKSEAAMHLVQGKRHLLVKDYYSAVDSLQRACEIFSSLYGDTAAECAEPLFYYGKALLELARKESGALELGEEQSQEEDGSSDEDEEEEEGGAAGEENQEGEEEPEQDEDLEKPEPALQDPLGIEKSNEISQSVGISTTSDSNTGGSSSKSEEATKPEIKDDKSKPEVESEKSQPSDAETETGTVKPETGTAVAGSSSGVTESESEANVSQGEEDVSNLQLAWEVLELSKKIFRREAEKDTEQQPELYLKVADILLYLGEISLESDNCAQAIEDLSESLRIQQAYLEPDSRQMAETHYQLGLSYSFNNQYAEAVEHFKEAHHSIELRLQRQRKFVEEGKTKEREGSLDDDPVWRAEREIEDLEALLPEMQSKIDDTEDMLRQNCSDAKDAIIQEMMDRTPEASPVKNVTASVNVISSSLIKRKRPADETLVDDAKKTKPETNGVSKENGGSSKSDENKVETSPVKKVLLTS